MEPTTIISGFPYPSPATMLVGSYEDDDKGTDAGAAYVFYYDGSQWIEEAKLTAGDGAAGDHFGVSVSLSADYAIIGADWDDDRGTFSGSAYVFHHDGSGWVEQSKLLAGDGDLFDNFGQSVALSGDLAVVGSLYDGDNGFASGSAYVFHREGSNWVQQAKLLADDGAPTDYFGWSVSVSGDFILIGANGDNNAGMDAGSAYIFHYDGSTWTQQAKLLASDRSTSDNFGRAVCLDGDKALIGAPYNNDLGTFSGSGYVFRYDGSTWIQEAKLLASDGSANDDFGLAVSISGDYALVGAPYDDDNGTAGSAYLFHFDGSTWVQQSKILASDGAPFDYFGASVSLRDDRALIGAYQEDDKGSNAGSAYVYSGVTAGISCNDIASFRARCQAGGLVQVRITMTDNSHYGESVVVSVDGSLHEIVIDHGGRALFSQSGFNAGSHTVELTDPSACYDPLTVRCSDRSSVSGEEPWASDANDASWNVPANAALFNNYPNPCNPSTTISYGLSESGNVTLKIYDIMGQLVRTIVNGFQAAGYHETIWDGTNESGSIVAGGVYMYRLTTGRVVESKKMVVLK